MHARLLQDFLNVLIEKGFVQNTRLTSSNVVENKINL